MAAWWRYSSALVSATALLLAARVTAQPEFPVCVKMAQADLPSSDFQTCGLDMFQLWGFQYALYTDRKCSTPACMRLYAFVDAANPAECYVDMMNQYRLRARILAQLNANCAARTESPSLPAAANPPAPPAPPTPLAPPGSSRPTILPVTPRPATTTTATSSPPSSASTPKPPSSSGSNTEEPSPTTLGSEPVSKTPSASASSPRATPSRDAERVSNDAGSASGPDPSRSPSRTMAAGRLPDAASADAQVRQAAKTSESNRSPIYIGVSVAVVAVVGIIVFAWVRQSHPQQNAAKLDTNASSHGATATHESGTGDATYHAWEDGLVSLNDRNEMEAILRDDRTLESWRLRSTTVVDKKFLGKGGHAFVHLVALPDGSLLASKRLVTNQLTVHQFKQLVVEVHMVVTLKHRNIVRFAGVVWSSPLDFQVLFEYMEGGNLRNYLDKNKPNGVSTWPKQKLQMALDIAEGLTYAHSFNPPLVHRDLKSRNILLTQEQQTKISDFGVSRFQSENDTMTTGIGTNRWLAPEVISGGGSYNERCDIYSFGVVLTELDTHDVPLTKEMARSPNGTAHKRSEMWLLQEVAQGRLRPSMSESAPREMRALATQCLSFEPASRPNTLEIAYTLRKLIRDAAGSHPK